MKSQEITITINGRRHDAVVDVRRTLADFLREDLGLTGTHLGCEHGVCGACTIVVDGATLRSCLQLAVQADGREVTTVEGLAGADGDMHPVQQALHDKHAFQCGFCTPGFVMAIYEMYSDQQAGRRAPCSRGQLREDLSGNICRCTGYSSILDGAQAVLGAVVDQGDR